MPDCVSIIVRTSTQKDLAMKLVFIFMFRALYIVT